MLSALFLILVLFVLTQPILSALKRTHAFLNIKILIALFWYHYLFAGIYYTYAILNRSDSKAYFQKAGIIGIEWMDLLTNGTRFIEWVAFPFVQYLDFNYEMMMVLFAWMGYIGFVFFYLFFKENLKLQIRFYGYDVVHLLLFLPNMHFWTSSLGKGSIIFCGIGLLVYGLSYPGKRKILMALGGFLVYFVRPHVFFAIMIGMGVSFMLGREKIPLYQKVLTVIGGIVVSVLIYDKLLDYLRLSEDNVWESFVDQASFTALQLRSAGSAVDMGDYNLIMKLFTFWFRPLFFDAPNVLGIFVSLENLLYLFFFGKILHRDFFRYIKQAPAVVKMSAVVFISISISMTYVMSNLGIIIRQKSMIMYFMFFLIVAFLDWKQSEKVRKRIRYMRYKEIKAMERKRKLAALRENI